MIRVYHLVDYTEAIRIRRLDADAFLRVAKFREIKWIPVADVDTNDIDTAFQLTNNIDSSWAENRRVTPLFKGDRGCRSTSVGDLIIDQGMAFLCDPVGWTCVGPMDDAELLMVK